MSRDELLKALGLSSDELNDLLKKLRDFLDSLNAAQRTVIERSLPVIKEALTAFGPNVTEAELLALFKGDIHHPPVICIFPLHHRKYEK